MSRIIEAGDLLTKKPKKKKKKKVVLKDDTPKKKKKKKVVSEDDAPKKKKKKKKTSVTKASSRDRDSILAAKAKLKKLPAPVTKSVNTEVEEYSQEDESMMREFEEIYGEHVKSLSVEDQEQMQEYFTMFHQLKTIARRFEVKSKQGSSKDVYALMKIYDQMREIIADLKALKDISQIADKLQEDVLIPYSRIVVSELSTIRSATLKAANRLLPPENQKAFQEAFDSTIIGSSQKLEEGFNNARFSILDIYAE